MQNRPPTVAPGGGTNFTAGWRPEYPQGTTRVRAWLAVFLGSAVLLFSGGAQLSRYLQISAYRSALWTSSRQWRAASVVESERDSAGRHTIIKVRYPGGMVQHLTIVRGFEDAPDAGSAIRVEFWQGEATRVSWDGLTGETERSPEWQPVEVNVFPGIVFLAGGILWLLWSRKQNTSPKRNESPKQNISPP